MKKIILTVSLPSLAIISLYFIFSPYQNCKRDYVGKWLEREEARGKYVSDLDIRKRQEFCISSTSW